MSNCRRAMQAGRASAGFRVHGLKLWRPVLKADSDTVSCFGFPVESPKLDVWLTTSPIVCKACLRHPWGATRACRLGCLLDSLVFLLLAQVCFVSPRCLSIKTPPRQTRLSLTYSVVAAKGCFPGTLYEQGSHQCSI